jgi:hypothetical protein
LVALAAWLLSAPAKALSPEQEVQQMLHSLGVQSFFASAELLVERELQRDNGEQARSGANPGEQEQLIRQQLSGAGLQAAVETLLLQQYDGDLYRLAINILAREDLAPVIQSCHGQALQDYGPQLQAYQQQLALHPARADRVRLAMQLDRAARTSELVSQLHSGIERLIYDQVADGASVPWQEVEAERLQVLREAVQTWYLYCGRFFRDDLLQALVDSYRDSSIQQILDQYQAAVATALEQAVDTIDSHESE